MKNVRYQFACLCLGFGFLALAAFPVAAQSPHVPNSPFIPLPLDYFETAGRVQVVQPINNLTLPGGKRLFEDTGLSTDGASGVKSAGQGDITNPSGNKVRVAADTRIPNANVAGALGRATQKIVGSVVGPLGVGLALWELYKELNFDLSKDADGNAVVKKIDPNVCTVSPCYDYRVSTADGSGVTSGYKSTALLAASAFATAYNAYPSYGTYLVSLNECDASYCYFDKYYDSNNSLAGARQIYEITKRSIAAQPTTYLPSTQQEFLDAVAAKSGWPSTSALSRALRDSVSATGEKVITGTPVVSGPATSPGTTSVTNNVTNNTTKTETVTHQHTYSGNTITTTNVTNIVVVNNTTGDTISNETTTSTPKPAPATDQCKEFPDTAGCAKLGTLPESDKLTKKTEAVSVVAVAFAGGSCPPPVTFSVMSQSHSFSYGPLCDRLAVLKFLFLAIAGVLAAYILADSFKV